MGYESSMLASEHHEVLETSFTGRAACGTGIFEGIPLRKQKLVPIDPSEITPEHVFFSRRKFLAGLGALAVSSATLGPDCRRGAGTPPPEPGATDTPAPSPSSETPTPYDSIANYNNFYEFSLDKEDVAELARDFKTSPWTVKVGGLVNRPGEYDIDTLVKRFPPEERVYCMRCVEGWSMVIPWLGFPLASLLKEVAPTSEAKFVRFETLLDPARMPGQKHGFLNWPYVEGLRLDEAMHNLTILATGLYGKPLPPQCGAPIRLVVPWKYGFKNIKSIVRIDLVTGMPGNTWADENPSEYGFYANVNPDVPHPRWSQASERRIGELARRRTLLFNGYADEVAHLYAGMDLTRNF